MPAAIRVAGLSKRFVVNRGQVRHDTLRDYVTDRARALWRRDPQRAQESFWALRDVSFEVGGGDIVGIIGRNGAGKSTLLKVLSRITEPTTGRAEILGRVGSLLEVGTGFDRELSGRENIYLSGAILGMRRAEIRRNFDAIVAFADVAKFIDTPVKRYSSGMYVRLAFAVAAHLEPEILLVDEVLAVGDAAFQRKCLAKMDDVARAGRTILFVSHNMGAITRLCRSALWLDASRLRSEGPAEAVVARYLAAALGDQGEIRFEDAGAPGSEHIRLRGVRIRDHGGRVATSLDVRYPFTIEVEYTLPCAVSNLRVGVRLTAQDGAVVLTTTDADGAEDGVDRQAGVYVSTCRIPGNFLNYGHYAVCVAADFPMVATHFLVDHALTFTIEQTGGVGGSIPDGRQGVLRVQLPWQIATA